MSTSTYSSQKEFATFPALAGATAGQKLVGGSSAAAGSLALWSDPTGAARVELGGATGALDVVAPGGATLLGTLDVQASGSKFVGSLLVDHLVPNSGAYVDLNGSYAHNVTAVLPTNAVTTIYTLPIPNGATYVDAEFVGTGSAYGQVFATRATYLFISTGGVVSLASNLSPNPVVAVDSSGWGAGITISGGNLLFQVNSDGIFASALLVNLCFRVIQAPAPA